MREKTRAKKKNLCEAKSKAGLKEIYLGEGEEIVFINRSRQQLYP
jgi:hypothetical protein